MDSGTVWEERVFCVLSCEIWRNVFALLCAFCLVVSYNWLGLLWVGIGCWCCWKAEDRDSPMTLLGAQVQ